MALEDAGLKVWFDQLALLPGDPWMENLTHGLVASASCAILIGKEIGLWQQMEAELALHRAVEQKDLRLLPVLLPGDSHVSVLSSLLARYNHVDFSNGLEDDNALWSLECGVRGMSPHAGRPQADPLPPEKTAPPIDPAVLDVPGGTLDAESPFYIKRNSDSEVLDFVFKPGYFCPSPESVKFAADMSG